MGPNQGRSLFPKKLWGLPFDLSHFTPMATKVHVILMRYVVLTWMRDYRDVSALCDIMKQC